jgi:hypothetical protein
MVPLPPEVVASLEDPTSALAAAFVIARVHPDLLAFVARTVCGEEPEPQPGRRRGRGRKANGNGDRKPRNGDPRLPSRDEADERLIAAMRKNPDGVINDWVMIVGKSRTSVVAGLHRLRDAGLAESVEGKWRLIEELAPREPPAKWIAPLSAAAGRAHASA